MKIQYSSHAQKRMIARQISQSHVQLTVFNPDTTFQTSRGRGIARKRLNNKTLEVIYVVEQEKIIIITLYYL